MRVVLSSIDGKEYTLKKITEMSFIQTYGVACDAVLVSFIDDYFDEIYGVRVFYCDKLIFNGYCDNQKYKLGEHGASHSIYARSSACLLVDSRSQPYTFLNPSARQLYINYAKDKAFDCALPDISCTDKYEVQMGTSCFGAINNFVRLLTDNEVFVDCNDTLRISGISKDVKSLDAYCVCDVTHIINRSEPIAQINFKNTLSKDYTLHAKASIADELKISRQEYVNLTSLPQWQRNHTINRRLNASFADYKTVEVVVKGYFDSELGQRFSFSAFAPFEDYILREKHYSFGRGGERTKLLLKKKIDTGGFTYVA